MPEPVAGGRIASLAFRELHLALVARICLELAGRDALPQSVTHEGFDAAPAGKQHVPATAQHPFRQSEKTACKGFPSGGIAL